jgi:homoserine kinase
MGLFVSSLYMNDAQLFKTAMHDVIIEPMRSMLIPKFEDMKKAALDSGALAFGISGSGPSVFAISQGEDQARKTKDALEKIYQQTDIDFTIYLSPINSNSGATIISNEL